MCIEYCRLTLSLYNKPPDDLVLYEYRVRRSWVTFLLVTFLDGSRMPHMDSHNGDASGLIELAGMASEA